MPIFMVAQDEKNTGRIYYFGYLLFFHKYNFYAFGRFYNIQWSSTVIGSFTLAALRPWLAINVRRLLDQGKISVISL
jgi:uncharacterized membrane protein YhaH (DUF805 family)